jgi:hypothetical protein
LSDDQTEDIIDITNEIGPTGIRWTLSDKDGMEIITLKSEVSTDVVIISKDFFKCHFVIVFFIFNFSQSISPWDKPLSPSIFYPIYSNRPRPDWGLLFAVLSLLLRIYCSQSKGGRDYKDRKILLIYEGSDRENDPEKRYT